MNKNIQTLLLSTLLFLPILGMENQQEKEYQEQTRSESAKLLDYIARTMTDVELYNKSPWQIQDIILHLEGFDKQAIDYVSSRGYDVPSNPEYLAHVEKMQQLLKSEAAIKAIADVFEIDNEPEVLADIIKNSAIWTIPSFFGKDSTSTPTTISITPIKKETSLATYRKKVVGTQKTKITKNSKTRKIEDILTAREFLMQLYPTITTFESGAKDFHCIFSCCGAGKKTFKQKHSLINHIKTKHRNELDAINRTKKFDRVITARTLNRIMDYSNNFKPHKRSLVRPQQ
jgi:hypothetical protein